ncbi:hypothetical protein [Pseudoxanthomonas sp. PXM04]|jgi:hypothetical protein|uniref:hypothetical protein n=1 Tax=Pseudoxanthomonas sp. PXM04 TaxID=2769297 RepID=UPI00178161F7|nr:hypothetical protein [Pseudoxanthomonas sp. PXM04]MBD9376792.1 hypothetical protein [Pseudoxanthomonas sp. PXM04]
MRTGLCQASNAGSTFFPARDNASLDTISLLVVGLGALALMLVVALPAWVAWFIACRSRMPVEARRSFILACLLLTFGFVTLAGGLFLPLDLAAIYLAPQWSVDGHMRTANAILVLAEYGSDIACLATGLLASIIVPLKLRCAWPRILVAARGGK